MFGVTCFDGEVEIGAFGRHIEKESVVRHLDDVTPGIADDARDTRQGAGLIGALETQRDEAAFAHELTLQHDGEQSAAAHRYAETIKIRLIFEHLERDCALADDDVLIVVGMHEDQVLAPRDLVGVVLGFGELLTMQHHPCAQQPRLLNFVEGRVDRHDDGCRDAEPRGVMRYPSRMVARRHGDYAAASLVCIESRQLAERAVLLERGRELLIFEFEVDLGTGDGRQGLRARAGVRMICPCSRAAASRIRSMLTATTK